MRNRISNSILSRVRMRDCMNRTLSDSQEARLKSMDVGLSKKSVSCWFNPTLFQIRMSCVDAIAVMSTQESYSHFRLYVAAICSIAV